MKRNFLIMSCLMVISICSLAGCADNSQFVPLSYTAGISEVQAVAIDVRDRQIDVSVSEDDMIRIDYSASSKEGYDIAVSEDGVLSMSYVSNKDWTDFIGTQPSIEYRKISLCVPADVLGSLMLSTTNDNITIEGLSVTDRMEISSNGGNISFDGIGVGKALDISAKNGNIRGTVIGSYDDFSIHSAVKKGNCNLPSGKDGGEKALNVSVNNGNISIDFV